MRVFRVIGRLLLAFCLAMLGLSLTSAIAAALMRDRLADDAEPDDDEVEIAAIYTGREFRSLATSFRGGRFICWYAGCEVDLRGARLHPAGGDLEVWTIFGGLRIRVPEDWRVRVRGMAVFGGASAMTTPLEELDPGPELSVRHRTLFGGFNLLAAPDDELLAV